MRRLVVIGALLGLIVFPAQASAAEPPDPTISVSSVHYAGRGVIELDLAYSCSTPSVHTSYWEPYLAIELYQGRGRAARYAGFYPESATMACDGQLHTQVVRLTSEDGPRFRGGAVYVSAWVDACYEIARTGEWVEKYGGMEGRFRVRHSG